MSKGKFKTGPKSLYRYDTDSLSFSSVPVTVDQGLPFRRLGRQSQAESGVYCRHGEDCRTRSKDVGSPSIKDPSITFLPPSYGTGRSFFDEHTFRRMRNVWFISKVLVLRCHSKIRTSRVFVLSFMIIYFK